MVKCQMVLAAVAGPLKPALPWVVQFSACRMPHPCRTETGETGDSPTISVHISGSHPLRCSDGEAASLECVD